MRKESTIIAGRFSIQSQVTGAVEALHREGFSADHISSFYVNPPGQHDLYRYGGDLDRSHGAFDLEVARGHVEDRDWVDFDPREAPQMLRQDGQ
jgi:hypothetical protein